MIWNPWLIFSLVLLGIWLLVWLVKPGVRKEMFLLSICTMPFGLTEPLFVPEYWNPPSLFNLAARTGFDIESFIFTFAIGGLGAVIYEAVTKGRHKKISKAEKKHRQHEYHVLALTSPFILFVILELITTWNPIYTGSMAMFGGGITAMICRPDLKKKVWIGGTAFLLLYFLFFLGFNMLYPDVVGEVWNLAALSGILVAGIPLEELLFAFTFGMLWSSFYEHALWVKRVEVKP